MNEMTYTPRPQVGQVATLQQALAVFDSIGMPSRNYSKATRTHYKSDIQILLAFLQSMGVTEVRQVTLAHLEFYQAEMDLGEYRASSRNRKTHAIKSFFDFLKRQRIIKVNPADELIPPTPSHDEPRVLTRHEYQALLRAVSHDIRDAAIIELFLQTGIRLSELAQLTTHDISLPTKITKDPDNMGSIRVKRKGGRFEMIPLNYKACKALAAYLRIRPSIPEPGLFISKYKEPLGKRSIQNIVKKYMEEAGIAEAHTHTLRHTHATHHAAKGTPLPVIQGNLGHASLKTTSIYITLAKESQKKALQENAL
jgi:site-specific recombinase XerD